MALTQVPALARDAGDPARDVLATRNLHLPPSGLASAALTAVQSLARASGDRISTAVVAALLAVAWSASPRARPTWARAR